MSAVTSTGCMSPLPAVLLTSTGDGTSLSADELPCEVLSVLLCEPDASEGVLSPLVDEFVELVELVESTELSELCPPPAAKDEPPFSEQPAKHDNANIAASAEIILFFIRIPPLRLCDLAQKNDLIFLAVVNHKRERAVEIDVLLLARHRRS